MIDPSIRRLCIGVLLLLMPTAWAQEGHPLTGTWSGDWGLTDAERNHVTLVMNWDGESVTGTLNPGPDSIAIRVAFDPATWGVGFEVELDDASRNPVTCSFQGTLENYGALYSQQIVGVWSHPGARGEFRITRQ